VRFAIRPDGPLRQITDFADIHPLLAVYATLPHAMTGQVPIPLSQRRALTRTQQLLPRCRRPALH
jgi:hypothetical protein